MATRKGPGKAFREGMTLAEFFRLYPEDDEDKAERFFIEQRWPKGIHCAFCGSDNVQVGAKHHMPYRCRERKCRKRFSTRTRSLMEGSNLPFHKWLTATYLIMTNLKGVSSMKLSRDLGVTQKTAWFLAHRIREALDDEDGYPFMDGPVEVDETFVGGRRGNMHAKRRKQFKGRGTTKDKTIVAGLKDRRTGRVKAAVVPNTGPRTLRVFVEERLHHEATLYSDEQGAYRMVTCGEHQSIVHSRSEYVKPGTDVHTQGIESFWSMLKRAHKGTFHKWSPKHLFRYVQEFAGRHNVRPLDTHDQMKAVARRMRGRRLKYADLVR